MSFPASLTTRIFKGGFVTYPDGVAAKGTVRIVLKTPMIGPSDDLFIVPFDITVPLDETGRFAVILPATDDPQWTPSSYSVTVITVPTKLGARPLIRLGNMPAPSILRATLQVPYNQTGPIDASDIFNVTPPTMGESYIALASMGAPGGVATLGSDGKVPSNQLPTGLGGDSAPVSWLDLLGKPTTFPPDAHTHVTVDVSGLDTALSAKASTTALTTGLAGKADVVHTHTTSQVTGLDTALGAKANSTDLTTGLALKANSTDLTSGLASKADSTSVTTALATKADSTTVATSLAAKADLVGGVLPTSQLPAIAVIDFLGSVSGQAAMLALTGQKGDWCIRTDLGQSWVITGTTTTSLGSWTAMPIGTSPVQTVNGQTGTVVLAKGDIGLGNVDNTTDAGKPVSTAQQTALDVKANLASPTFTGTVSGVTAAMVGLGSVNNTADSAKPVSTAQQTALDLKANLVSPTFTGTVAGVTATMVGLGNVTNTSDANKPVSTAQQTALNLKANAASPAFTGTATGLTASMVGLGSVNNTADSAKPVSIAQQTALNLKSNITVGVFNVADYGAVGNGTTDDTAAFNAALAAMPTKTLTTSTSATYPVGILRIPSGTFKLGSAGVDVNNIGPLVSVKGNGKGATYLDYYGAGSALRQFNSVYPTSDTFDTLTAFSGALDGFTILGTNCQAGASGLRYGDTEGGVIGPDIMIRGFNKTGCDGLLFDNQYSWLENVRVWANTYDNTNGVRFHGTGGATGTTSFMYNSMEFKTYSFVNQNGVVLDGGAYYVNGSIKIRANMYNSSSAQTGALLTVTGSGTSGHLGAGVQSQIVNCELQIHAEANGPGSIGPMTIRFGDVGANYIANCYGVIGFQNPTWQPSNWTLAGNYANGSFSFNGYISGDANLSPVDGGYTVRSAVYYGASTLFTDGGTGFHQGDFLGPTTLTQNITVNMGSGKGGPQRKTIIIQQAATGGPYTVTWPQPGAPTLSSPAVYWAGGIAPVMSTAASAVDVYHLVTIDGVRWFGMAQQAASTPSGLVLPSDHTYSGWTFSPDMVQAGTILPTAGLSYIVRMRLMSTTLSAINIHLTAAGATLTNAFVTVHNDAGVMLTGAVSANQATAWASGGLKTMALTTPQTGLTYGAWYKVRFWVGTATTMPTLSRAINSASAITNAGLVAPNFRYGTADAGLTTVALAPTTIGTITGGPTAWWVSATP